MRTRLNKYQRKVVKKFLRQVTLKKRRRMHRAATAMVAVIDSKSVLSGYSQSEKGVDGHIKIKGIKRQLSVDSHGLPLCIDVTRGNVHDSKGVTKLLSDLK